MRMHDIVMSSLPDFTIFFHVIMNSTIFGGKNVIEHNVYFGFLYNFVSF